MLIRFWKHLLVHHKYFYNFFYLRFFLKVERIINLNFPRGAILKIPEGFAIVSRKSGFICAWVKKFYVPSFVPEPQLLSSFLKAYLFLNFFPFKSMQRKFWRVIFSSMFTFLGMDKSGLWDELTWAAICHSSWKRHCAESLGSGSFAHRANLEAHQASRRDDDSGPEPDMLVTSLVRSLSEKVTGMLGKR